MIEGIYLLLGSNLGDKRLLLQEACQKIEEQIGKVKQLTAIYETAAWGKEDQPSFYNQVLEIETEYAPELLLQKTQAIENEMGRVRMEKWGSRIIDIDILYYNSEVLTKDELVVPHPGIPDRRFTLTPLTEIAPDFVHPILGLTNQKLLQQCTDMLPVQKISLD
ncbi:2-amino-4-hydroxy-6-hydroxymethyldihydropteridine diphosphokinase [Fulvivirga ligni]|uniref:2-amino-4-hydroxy-6- hydroxymethyldihydropteridine diphosphokinase n=1 Tax=Fulvivirga ligni TaxID=2904246 RepID=UPI001F191F99|nr:2-amino-4-hydroxy-6-hydroxymethyldihydropteridine diphosphokinase [Fulvivirga ligni]UII21076.1 2-amino-4-hydroxy-6-hydroxymethyldihydropteridine diphosphokinase [Fulvivirga ligni]